MYKVALIGDLRTPSAAAPSYDHHVIVAGVVGVFVGVLGLWAWQSWGAR